MCSDVHGIPIRSTNPFGLSRMTSILVIVRPDAAPAILVWQNDVNKVWKGLEPSIGSQVRLRLCSIYKSLDQMGSTVTRYLPPHRHKQQPVVGGRSKARTLVLPPTSRDLWRLG